MNRSAIPIYMSMQVARLLGLCAALLLALGPAAPYLSGSSSKTYIEICTAFGIVKKAVEGDLPASGGTQPGHKESAPCLYCGLRQFALTPPESPALPLPSFAALSWPPADTATLSAARSTSFYNPRGPPLLLS